MSFLFSASSSGCGTRPTPVTPPGAHGHAEEHTRLDRSGLGRLAFYEWLRPLEGPPRARPSRIGSAAVVLMVLSIIREPLAALGYLLLFRLGTIGGFPKKIMLNQRPKARW
jgi:hypothetical protein